MTLALSSARDPRWVARRIEAKHPELGTALLAAVEQDVPASSDRLGYLQTAVIREALEHHKSHNWDETVPTRTLRGTQVIHAVALAGLIAVVIIGALQLTGTSLNTIFTAVQTQLATAAGTATGGTGGGAAGN